MSGLTEQEQATLLDIVKQYEAGQATPQAAMAWIYGLVSNSALWPDDDEDAHERALETGSATLVQDETGA